MKTISAFLLALAISFPLHATDKVIGGSETSNEENPWLLSLQTRYGGHLCGASLIREDLVLTAAHCVDAFSARDFRLYGKSPTGEQDDLRRVARVKAIHIHPDFNEKNLAHDIAVLELRRPVQLTDNLRVIKIPDNDVSDFDYTRDFSLINTGELISAGWGARQTPGNFPVFSQQLMEVEVKALGTTADLGNTSFTDFLIQDFNMSDEMIAFLLERDPNVLLTTGRIPQTGNCVGDSGGPLVHFTSGHEPQLVGITSYSVGGLELCKGVVGFTNIQAYRDWIRGFE